MTDGSTLLKLQELDLELERLTTELNSMPEIRELAKKRKAYQKLKQDATKLLAQRKDIENELSELDENEAFCMAAVDQAQSEMADPANYHVVRDLEVQLSSISKRLDKIEFTRKEKRAALTKVLDAEAYASDYIAKFEASVISDTRMAREKAAGLQNDITVNKARRQALVDGMDRALYERYEAASKRFRGLGVERLEGTVPSVCRTALSPSSMDELASMDEVGECPYCHRIIVRSVVE